jgi:hypothetical protein
VPKEAPSATLVVGAGAAEPLAGQVVALACAGAGALPWSVNLTTRASPTPATGGVDIRIPGNGSNGLDPPNGYISTPRNRLAGDQSPIGTHVPEDTPSASLVVGAAA